MAILADVKRLYDIAQSTILALLEPLSMVRFRSDDSIERIREAYSFAFHKLIENRAELQSLLNSQELSDLLHRTVAYQSRFVPEQTTTFASQAIGLMDRMQGLFMQLSESIDSKMSVEWKLSNDSRIWHESGYRRDDFAELKRGLVWEFATVKRVIAEHNIETVAPSSQKSGIDWGFARTVAAKGEILRSEAEQQFYEQQKQTALFHKYASAWDHWQATWENCRLHLDGKLIDKAYDPQAEIALALQSLVELIGQRDLMINLIEAYRRFDPLYYQGSTSEQQANAVKIVLQLLVEIQKGVLPEQVAKELLGLLPLPDLTGAKSAYVLIRVAMQWPILCRVCGRQTEPNSFDRPICGECSKSQLNDKQSKLMEPKENEAKKPHNTKERQEELVKIGSELISKKKFPSQAKLAEAMKCDCRSVAFKAVWTLHKEKYGPKHRAPKSIGVHAANSIAIDPNREELDRLIDEQAKDCEVDSVHRNGRRAGNRSKV